MITSAAGRPRVRRTVRLLAAVCSAALLGGVMVTSAAPAEAATLKAPSAVAWVKVKGGPHPGELTFRWKTDGKNTDYYRIDTALTMFSRTDHSMPTRGRSFHQFVIRGGSKRSVTLTADQLAAAGAPLGSANHLYFRFYAVNQGPKGTIRERPYKLSAARPKALAPTGDGAAVRVASFNVRTANLPGDTGSRSWANRVGDVAQTIVSAHPGLIGLQELSPGAYNGKAGGVAQTVSLERSLAAHGGGRYKLVRTTSYNVGWVTMGSQGARILYDSERYRLLSDCPDMTGSHAYSASCTVRLPLRKGDSEQFRRLAAVAKFSDRTTGQDLIFVSAHLEHRSGSGALGRSLEKLRGDQMKTLLAAVAKMNPNHLPVIFSGDINSYQNSPLGYDPHNQLIKAGYYDTAAARSTENLGYGTMNAFKTTVTPFSTKYGPRLDVIATLGMRGASHFKIIVKRTDAHRASDHNMIISDFRMP